MIGTLPKSLLIDGQEHEIRTDYRCVLNIFEMFLDREIETDDEEQTRYEKWILCFYLLFPEFESVDDVEDSIADGFSIIDAIKQVIWFFNANMPQSQFEQKPVFDWEHDEQMIFSAVNEIAGQEIRELDYMHWWTFVGYFNQLKECLFTAVVHIRKKRNDGKKLDTAEKQFALENRELFELPSRESKARQAILDKLNSGELFT